MHRERRPSELAPFIPGRQQFLYRDSTGALTQLADRGDSLVDFLLTPVHLRHDPGDATPMTRNDQRFAPLHIIQELGQMNLGFRCLNLAHINFESTSQFNQFHFITIPPERYRHPSRWYWWAR